VKQWLERERPDVVHANSLLMVPEATVARRLGLPVLTQVHELPRPGVKRGLTIRWAATVSCLLVAVSEAVAVMLRPPAGKTPVRVVRNGVAVTGPARVGNDGIVGTVGYVSRTKGTDVFLRAAALALERADLRFEHIGDHRLWGDDEFDDEVDRIASEPALRARASFLGRANASEALAGWETFVLASRSEGFPLSSLEAMAAGLPVIATNVGGVPEQIEHLETGILVRPEDPEALADWIVRLHNDAALRARLGSNARDVVRDRFSLEAQADGLASAYQEVVERGTRGRRG
jgi:glycosyltransferase involved in cell wall biosynthesis